MSERRAEKSKIKIVCSKKGSNRKANKT